MNNLLSCIAAVVFCNTLDARNYTDAEPTFVDVITHPTLDSDRIGANLLWVHAAKLGRFDVDNEQDFEHGEAIYNAMYVFAERLIGFAQRAEAIFEDSSLVEFSGKLSDRVKTLCFHDLKEAFRQHANVLDENFQEQTDFSPFQGDFFPSVSITESPLEAHTISDALWT